MMQDTRYRMHDAGFFPIQDSGYTMHDARYKIQDARYRIED
jgi:hypothetical protein